MPRKIGKNLVNEELAAGFALSLVELFPQAGMAFAGEAVHSAFAWGERCLALFEAHNPLPEPIACQAGCDYCCYNQVELTAPEALWLGAALTRRLPPRILAAVLDQAEKSCHRRAGKTKQEIAAERASLPCPLLQERRCLLYEVRPLMCRAMHSLEVRDCAAELARPQQARVRFYEHRQVIFISLSQGLIDACRTLGLQGGPVDLARSLLDYCRHPDPQAAWLRREQVFTPPSPIVTSPKAI